MDVLQNGWLMMVENGKSHQKLMISGCPHFRKPQYHMAKMVLEPSNNVSFAMVKTDFTKEKMVMLPTNGDFNLINMRMFAKRQNANTTFYQQQ